MLDERMAGMVAVAPRGFIALLCPICMRMRSRHGLAGGMTPIFGDWRCSGPRLGLQNLMVKFNQGRRSSVGRAVDS